VKAGPLQYLRSLLFVVVMYVGLAAYAVVYTPLAIVNRDYAFHAVHAWCAYVRWLARWMVGLRSEIRGRVPEGEVLVAAKHQSFFDIILIVAALPRPKFIMKKQLIWAPIVGWYAKRIGCVPVDRGRRAEAIRKMVADVRSGAALPGQLVIYPQGTRVAAGARMPYKAGAGVLYQETAQPCVPVATNVGVFWPRHGILRRPGLAVVEFMEPIAPGLPLQAFMAELEQRIEARSDALMRDAGLELEPAG